MLRAADLLWVSLATGPLFAHPMGNFSVNHYSRIELGANGAEVAYVLDLAEIPTFELLQQWKLNTANPGPELQQRAIQQAKEWMRNMHIKADGRAVQPEFERATAVLDKGAGGMAILRVTSELRLPVTAGALIYEDANYPSRAGWKEIVIRAGRTASIQRSSPAGPDRSRALTEYPQDPLQAPPQDLRASVEWQLTAPTVDAEARAAGSTPAEPIVASQPVQRASGMVVRGDFLSR